MTITKIFAEIVEERHKQDAQWGGPDHDDSHDDVDWIRYIEYQLSSISAYPDPITRERYLKVAALAVAAISSLDRKALP